jgi:hypothetical protein
MFHRNRILRAEVDGGGGGGGGAPTPLWYGDEAHKPVVEAKGFNGPGDVINWGVNLEKLLGAEKAGRTVVLPKDDKDADGIKAFRAKIGVPEKVDGYKVHEKLKDDPMLPAAQAAALKHGIPASAFEGFIADVIGAFTELDTTSTATAKAASEKEVLALRGEWGDKFDANAEMGRRFLKTLGVTDDQAKSIEEAIGTTSFLKMFHAGGTKLGELPGAGGGAEGGGGGVTREQAIAKLAEARTQRLENKLTDKQYEELALKYGPIAHPEPKAAA